MRELTELRSTLHGDQKLGEERVDNTHCSTDHLHDFQISVFLHSPVPKQLHPLYDDRVSSCISNVNSAVSGVIGGSNTRRFTPTANVWRDVSEQAQNHGGTTNRRAHNHLQHPLQE